MDELGDLQQLFDNAASESPPRFAVRDRVMERIRHQTQTIIRPWAIFATMSAAAAVIALGIGLHFHQTVEVESSSQLFPDLEVAVGW